MNTILRIIITAYRMIVSPLLGANCRFYPSCSAYAHQAFAAHPWRAALLLTMKRVVKCHPWHPGGVEMVPEKSHGEG